MPGLFTLHRKFDTPPFIWYCVKVETGVQIPTKLLTINQHGHLEIEESSRRNKNYERIVHIVR
jgi:hypothetical protein